MRWVLGDEKEAASGAESPRRREEGVRKPEVATNLKDLRNIMTSRGRVEGHRSGGKSDSLSQFKINSLCLP